MQRDVIERARGGDREAFATIATEATGRLFNIAQLILRDADRADDAVQETLVLACLRATCGAMAQVCPFR